MFLPRSDRRKFLKDELRHLLRGSRFDAEHRYVFHHLPKCAGTSARVALEDWFVNLLDYHKPWSDQLDENWMDDYINHPLSLSQLKARHLLIGHYNLPEIAIGKRYPDLFANERFRVFTFLRDPLELQLSLHFYEIREGMVSKDAPLAERILMRPNYMATSLPCDESNWKKVVDRYWFIGITEHLQESFDLLAGKLNKSKIKIPRLNETTRKGDALSPDLVQEFREINSLDYQLYEYALEKFRIEEGKNSLR